MRDGCDKGGLEPVFFMQVVIGIFQFLLGLFLGGDVLGYDYSSTRKVGYSNRELFAVNVCQFGEFLRFSRLDAFGKLGIHIGIGIF